MNHKMIKSLVAVATALAISGCLMTGNDDKQSVTPTPDQSGDLLLVKKLDPNCEKMDSLSDTYLKDCIIQEIGTDSNGVSVPIDSRWRPTPTVVCAWLDYQIEQGDSLFIPKFNETCAQDCATAYRAGDPDTLKICKPVEELPTCGEIKVELANASGSDQDKIKTLELRMQAHCVTPPSPPTCAELNARLKKGDSTLGLQETVMMHCLPPEIPPMDECEKLKNLLMVADMSMEGYIQVKNRIAQVCQEEKETLEVVCDTIITHPLYKTSGISNTKELKPYIVCHEFPKDTGSIQPWYPDTCVQATGVMDGCDMPLPPPPTICDSLHYIMAVSFMTPEGQKETEKKLIQYGCIDTISPITPEPVLPWLPTTCDSLLTMKYTFPLSVEKKEIIEKEIMNYNCLDTWPLPIPMPCIMPKDTNNASITCLPYDPTDPIPMPYPTPKDS